MIESAAAVKVCGPRRLDGVLVWAPSAVPEIVDIHVWNVSRLAGFLEGSTHDLSGGVEKHDVPEIPRNLGIQR